MGEMRVKDFTYYPIMSRNDCAFRLKNQRPVRTYHQCARIARREIQGYGFCEKHAQVVERETGVNNDSAAYLGQ